MLPEPKWLLLNDAAQLVARGGKVSKRRAQARLERAFHDYELVVICTHGNKVVDWEVAEIDWRRSSITIRRLTAGIHFVLEKCRLSRQHLDEWMAPIERNVGTHKTSVRDPPAKLAAAIRKRISAGDIPANTVPWKTFCDDVRDKCAGWSDGNRKHPARGFSDKTIKRIVKKLSER